MADILQEYDNEAGLYEGFANKVRQLLEEMIKEEKISYNAITCRLKSRDSLAKKIELKRDKYNSLKDLTDIAGIRIITFYSDDVNRVVELIEKEFEVDRENTIDKRQAIEPDKFGYCSVHYIVGLSAERLQLREYKQYSGLKCEIQVRTVLQHAWAEIEHDLGYKSEIAIPKEIRRNFSRLAGLLEIGDKEFLDIRNYLNNYTNDITEKISDDELDERELDSIIINEFIKSDPIIARLNQQIEQIYGSKIVNKATNCDYSVTIRRLNWLGVRTFGQLKNLIIKNEADAIKIAKIILKPRDDSNSNNFGFIENTIGLFYVNYAELLKSFGNINSIKSYLADAGISPSKGFPQKLLDIKKQLGL